MVWGVLREWYGTTVRVLVASSILPDGMGSEGLGLTIPGMGVGVGVVSSLRNHYAQSQREIATTFGE